MLKRVVPALLISLLASGPVFAEKLNVVSGSEAQRESFQLSKRIAWQSNVDDACREASKSGKLVFLLHILGDLDGKT
jgi:hypothetical protein